MLKTQICVTRPQCVKHIKLDQPWNFSSLPSNPKIPKNPKKPSERGKFLTISDMTSKGLITSLLGVYIQSITYEDRLLESSPYISWRRKKSADETARTQKSHVDTCRLTCMISGCTLSFYYTYKSLYHTISLWLSNIINELVFFQDVLRPNMNPALSQNLQVTSAHTLCIKPHMFHPVRNLILVKHL